MENETIENNENTKKNKPKISKKTIKYIVTFALLLVCVTTIVLCANFAVSKQTMQCISVSRNNNTITYELEIGDLKNAKNNKFSLKTANFSIMYEENQITASKINNKTGTVSIETDTQKTTVTITFSLPKSDKDLTGIENNLTLLYKGNKIKTSEPVKVII